MFLKKIYIIIILLLHVNIIYCQWNQLPISIGSANFVFSDIEANKKYLLASNQVYFFENSKWNILPNDGLPQAGNISINVGTAFNDKIIIGVNYYPQAGFFEFDKKKNKWNRLNFVLDDSFTVQNLIYQQNRLFASVTIFKRNNTLSQIYVSQNNGDSWKPDVAGIDFKTFAQITDLIFYENEFHLLTNNSLVFKRSEHDSTWKVNNNGINHIQNLATRNLIVFNGNIFMCTLKGFFIYDKTIETWLPINDGLEDRDTSSNSNLGYIKNKMITFGINSVNSRRGYVFNENLKKWERWPNLDSLIINNALNINDTLFLAATQGLYYITDLTDSPLLYMDGIKNARVNDLEFEMNELFAATSTNGILHFKDGLNTKPTVFNHPRSNTSSGIIHTTNHIIVSYSRGMGVYDKSMNLSYYVPQFHNSNVSTIYKFNKYIYANSGQSNFVCHEDSLIWRKTDLNTSIRQFYYHNGFVYAAGSTTGLYRTSIENENWEFLSGAFGPQQIQGVTAYNNTILVTTRDGLLTYNLTDKSWSKINTPFDNLGFQKITYFNGKIVVNTLFQSGVYVADTNDFIFHPLFNGINVNHFFINNMLIHNDTLFLASTQGIWYRPLHNINTSIRRYNENEMAVSVFPNPASSQVNISCTNEKIKGIVVYNSLGQKMDEITINNHQHIYQTSHLKEGIYFFNIMLNNQNMINHKVVVGY